MKKLNRKGFTLVELLAVIIILAIVVGITIPAILTTTSSARAKAYQASADSFADWLDRQYQATNIGDTSLATPDATYAKLSCTSSPCTMSSGTFADLLAAGGLKKANYATESTTITLSNGRYCVELFKNTTTGDYNDSNLPTSVKGGNC